MSRFKSLIVSVMIMTVMFTTYLTVESIVIAAPLSQNISSNTTENGVFKILLALLLGNISKYSQKFIPGLAEKLNLPAADEKSSKEVLGFYAEWWNGDDASYKSLTTNANNLTTIIPFWATLQPDGSISNRGGANHTDVVNFVHQHNIPALLLVNNAKNSASSSAVNPVIADPAIRKTAIDNLESYLKHNKLDGINIDFEMLSPGDKNNFTTFIKELSARLKPEGYVLSIDVMPKTTETDDVSIAYDYAELGYYADKVILMTYDNHADWSGPGPIAAIDWVENNLRYALKYIPKQKLYLGIAAYGYDWSDKGVDSLEYQSVVNLANNNNIVPIWDNSSQSPHFSYTDSTGMSHSVWYENRFSVKYKLNLVKSYDIAGIALWRLGDEDPADWPLISDKLHHI